MAHEHESHDSAHKFQRDDLIIESEMIHCSFTEDLLLVC